MRDDSTTDAVISTSRIETLIKTLILVMPARGYCAHCIRCLREMLAKVNTTRDYAIILRLSFPAPVRILPHSEYTMLLAGVSTSYPASYSTNRAKSPPIIE
jgi:bacterioferritin-associated ferredoxin